MKEFSVEKFCSDLIQIRGDETQQEFAKKIGVNRSTLSLLETGKQIPSLEILNKVCNLGSLEPSDFFKERNNDSLIYLMGKIDESDRKKVELVMDRIRIKEKYSLLSKRSENDINW